MATMAGQSGSGGRFHLSPVDRFGRAIDPAVLDAAARIGRRAIAFAEEHLTDPAVAANVLEECASAVSRVLQTKRRHNERPINDLEAYLFRAFIRRINKVHRRAPVTDNPGKLDETELSVSEDFELRILADEFLRRCDPITRDMYYRRAQGFSWKEIAKVYGISAHAAESRFSQTFQRVRKKLGLRD